MPDAVPVAYYRLGSDNGLTFVDARVGADADGELLDTAPPADAAPVWRTSASDRGLLRIEIPAERIPGAPPLWFVEVDEPRAPKPACNLVGFASDDLPAGTVVSKYVFSSLRIPNDRQAGAVRWLRDGRVDQIFVGKQLRRRNVGTTLLHAADAWHQARGWAGHLHADGRRTQLGQLFLAALAHPQRFAPLSVEMPPMDPDERTAQGTFSRRAAAEQRRGGSAFRR